MRVSTAAAFVALLTVALAAGSGPTVGAATATGSITGTVRAPGGEPLGDVEVYAIGTDGPFFYGYARTGHDGRYRIDQLVVDDYQVQFISPVEHLLGEYYANEPVAAGADRVAVRAGVTAAGIDAVLERSGSMEGTVSGPTGLPLAGVGVQVAQLGDRGCCHRFVSTTWDGRWSLGGLRGGSYVVAFETDERSPIASELYDDAATLGEATPVVVDAGQTTRDVDAQLVIGATVSGTVLGPTGAPLAGAWVSIEPQGWSDTTSGVNLYTASRRAVTGHDGTYTAVGVMPGAHLAHVSAPSEDLVGEWWEDTIDWSDATPIVVTATEAIGGIDAQLMRRGAITGTVTGTGSGPLPGILVDLLRPDGRPVARTSTDAAGRYEFTEVAATPHLVRFAPGATSGWRPEHAHDAASLPEADLIAVGEDGTTDGVDAVLELCGAPAMFSDVPLYQKFCAAIGWLGASGVGGGFADGTFRPSAPVSRQAVAAFLHRLAGDDPGPFPDPGFTDVPPSSPFHDDVSWLVDSGLGSGYADGTFRPTDDVTRQAVAAYLHRLAGSPVVAPIGAMYPDVPQSHPFFAPIWFLTRKQIISGYFDGTFKPGVDVSRQALASFLFSYVNSGLPTTVP